MNIAWTRAKPFNLVTTFQDGSHLEWSGSEWGRAKRVGDNAMFEPINYYLSTLSEEKLDTIEEVYRTTHAVFEDTISDDAIRQLIEFLKLQMQLLFEQIDWRDFCLALRLNKRVYLDNGIKDSFDDKDRPEITYLTNDYNDLVLFSVLIKLALPIWGSFYSNLAPIIGKPIVGIRAMNTIEVEAITSLAPWIKLVTHVNNFADLHVAEVGNSLLSDIGTDAVPEYLLSLTLSKKIAVHDATSTVSNLVADMYNTLFDRCADINSHKPNDKNPNDGRDNEISIADQYKPAQKIAPAIIEMNQVYIESYLRMAMQVDPTIPTDRVEHYVQLVDSRKDLNVGNYHRSLCAAALHTVLPTKTFSIIGYQHMMLSVGVAAALYEHWGFKVISELMVTVPQDPNLFRIRVAESGVRAFGNLPRDVFEKLDALYPYKSMGINPAVSAIDNILGEVIRYSWDINDPEFDNLRIVIARMILTKIGKQQEV